MFDIRLVAYEPFGERLGELPSPLHIEAGDPLSDMPSMRVKYSTSSAGSPLLNREVEMALEAYNPRAGAWFEPPNCRFVNVRSEGDSLDQADGISYTLPGYSWLLSRIQVFPLSASFVNGQVSDATKSEKAARDALNASQDALLRAMNKPKGTTVEIDSLQPSNQKTVWVDMTKPEAPVVKVYQNNQWVKAAASVQDEGKRAGALWVQHQQTQGQLRDVQDRSRLTKRTFNGRHAGSIFAELLEEAHARGNRLSGMQATFTKTHDSAGKPWPANPGVIQVNTGSDMGALLTTFVEGGQLDFRTNGRKLDVYIQDTELSRDASDSAVLRYGYHIDEAPDKSTIEGLAGSMLFIGDDGLIFSRDNPQAAQPWGVWESSVSQSGVKSVGVGERYARSALQEAAQRRVERTRGLVFHEGVTAPLPYVDYRPGDFVAAPGSSGSNEKQRVQQITLTKDGKTGQVAGNIVLNDRFLEREIKNSRSLKAVMGGGSISGTGGSRDQETYVDLRSPVPPRYVKGEAVGNYVKNLGIQAYMDVDWYWEAKATNGTAMADALTSFQVRYRLVQEGTSGTGPANSMAWVAAPDAPGDERQTTIGPIEGWNRRANAPAVYEVIVRACANNGKVSEWSKVGTIQVLTDNESPIAPSRPGARAEGSVLWVEWDGKMSSGGKPPADFLSIKVHEARVPDDAPRDENTQAVDDGYLNALSYTLVDSTPLTEAGAAPVFDRKYGEQYAYRLTAVDFFGNESEQSAPSQPVHTVPLVDDAFLQDQLRQAREESARQQAELDKKLESANDAIAAGSSRLSELERGIQDANEAIEAVVVGAGGTYVTYSAQPASKPGVKVGDTHFTMSNDSGPSRAIRQQRWDGSEWHDVTLSHETIASLDLAKATVGELDGKRIKADSITGTSIVGESVAGKVGRFLSLDVGQLTTTGTANINEAVVNNLWAKKIASKKIVTNEMMIGRGTNLVVNGYGEMGDTTNFSKFLLMEDTSLDSVIGATRTFYSYNNSGNLDLDSTIPVTPGSSYAFRVSSRGKNAGQMFFVRCSWRDKDGTELSGTYPVNGVKVPVGSWGTYNAILTAPEGAVQAMLQIYTNHVRGTQGENQWHAFGSLEFRDATEGRLIVDGSISTQHINAETFDVTKLLKANSIEAQYLKVDQIKDAVRIDSRLFYGQKYYGGSFVGAQFTTSEKAGARALFNTGGFYAFDGANRKTVEINADTGDVSIVGEFSTAPLGQPGVKLLNSASSWNNSDLGVWFTLDGNAYGWGGGLSTSTQDRSVAGVFLTPDSNDLYWNTLRLRGRGRLGDIMAYGGLTITPGLNNMGRTPFLFLNGTPRQHIASNAELQIWAGSPEYHTAGKTSTGVGNISIITGSGTSTMYIRSAGSANFSSGDNLFLDQAGRLYATRGKGKGGQFCFGAGSGYGWETGAAANVRMTSDGLVWMVTSKRANKLDIKPYEVDESILDLGVRHWVDRMAHEEHKRLDSSAVRPLREQDQLYLDGLEDAASTRSVGVIAEEALETGARDLVEYDQHGEVQGFAYPKLAVLHQPFLKELWEFKKKYEPLAEELEALLPKLRELTQ